MSLLYKFSHYFDAISVYPTGSRYICNPPILDTDDNYLVLVEDARGVYSKLINDGWEDCLKLAVDGSGKDAIDSYIDEQSYGVVWYAFRKGAINIMVSENWDWYVSSCAATELCKALNIKEKEQRIRIFRNLKYREHILLEDLP